ncbi:MAG: cupin domain-containing protein [Pseudomonadales bacterium]|nr:cupin domain-containing protein [Pseudomonadales bacterium]MCP5187080.1 cupin domain-containing protein [Pseudomonadales bacterium]
MAKFHPELDLLTEHAAGNLPLAQAACVSAHMNYCEQCRRTSSQLQALGSVLFGNLQGVPVGEAQLDAVLARLDDEPPLSYANARRETAGRTPAILQRLMSGDFSDLAWKKITSSLSISYLKTGDPNYEFALYHIKAGGRIPEHTHRGSEMTLVLEGGFSDADGSYHQGDFLLREPSDVHAPTAVQSEDCICLAVLDAPLKFTSWKYRWMNPFLQLRPG